MSGCGNCSGCAKCSGCSGVMELNEGELSLLEELGQIPFLPVARRKDDPAPIYLGEGDLTQQEYSLILQCLEKKDLISLDYDAPLKGFAGYGEYPICGSVALTAKGQQVLELMQINGIQ